MSRNCERMWMLAHFCEQHMSRHDSKCCKCIACAFTSCRRERGSGFPNTSPPIADLTPDIHYRHPRARTGAGVRECRANNGRNSPAVELSERASKRTHACARGPN
eukprot:6178918-Pleurochrysis_carterae.AAC.3